MTGQEICEAYARFYGLPEPEIAEWAKRFWEKDPSGAISHVSDAAFAMREHGFLPPEAPEVCSACSQPRQATGFAALAEVMQRAYEGRMSEEEKVSMAHEALSRKACGCDQPGETPR